MAIKLRPDVFGDHETVHANTNTSFGCELKSLFCFVSLLESICARERTPNPISIAFILPQQQQIRMKWANAHMKKDNRRRQTVKNENITRLRLNALRKNTILPHELQEIADAEIDALPRDSSHCRLVMRCAVTSRPRNNVVRYRLSRFVFRELADHNLLSGVQRASGRAVNYMPGDRME